MLWRYREPKGERSVGLQTNVLERIFESLPMSVMVADDDAGDEWMTVEEFLYRRFGLAVTHGICPEAMQLFLESD